MWYDLGDNGITVVVKPSIPEERDAGWVMEEHSK